MKRVATILLLVSLGLMPAYALEVDSDGYGSIFDGLTELFGIDSNAGLTAFPVLNIPIGGRSEGMAGSFAAVSDDISFLDWNPAGSATLEKQELAFFHNNWIADTKVEGAAFASRLRDLGFAAGGKWLYTPFTQYDLYGERVSKGYYSEAVGILNISYNFFSGYYFRGLSLGANLKGAYRFVPDYADNAGLMLSGSGMNQSTGIIMGDIGALTRFNFLKPYYSRDTNASAAFVVRNLGPPAMDDPLPTVATIAIAYKPIRPLLISVDLSAPLNLQEAGLSESPYGSVGVAAEISSFLSMRAGFLAKAGGVRLALGSAILLDRVALDINYTLDLMTQFTPLNRISLGVRFNLGDQGRRALSDQVDDLYLAGLQAYAEGNYIAAQSLWEEALRLNPRFDPARENLHYLTRSQAVERRISEIEQLNF